MKKDEKQQQEVMEKLEVLRNEMRELHIRQKQLESVLSQMLV